MKLISNIIILSLILMSCAHKIPKSTYKAGEIDYSLHGKFYGKMNIKYDSQSMMMADCALIFVDAKGEKSIVSIDDKGAFWGSAHAGQVALNEIVCKKDKYTFKNDGLNFQLKAGKTPTIIGSIDVEWNSNKINPFVMAAGLLVGWIAISSSGESIRLKTSKMSYRKMASDTNVNDHISLLKIPYGLEIAQ